MYAPKSEHFKNQNEKAYSEKDHKEKPFPFHKFFNFIKCRFHSVLMFSKYFI